jgi:hypothetical protein
MDLAPCRLALSVGSIRLKLPTESWLDKLPSARHSYSRKVEMSLPRFEGVRNLHHRDLNGLRISAVTVHRSQPLSVQSKPALKATGPEASTSGGAHLRNAALRERCLAGTVLARTRFGSQGAKNEKSFSELAESFPASR